MGGATRAARPISRPPAVARPPINVARPPIYVNGPGNRPGDGHRRRGDRRRTYVNGYGWPYWYGWSDYGGYDYYPAEAGSASYEPSEPPPEPQAAAEPICPVLIHWSDKLKKATRHSLCDEPGAASSEE
jgi:hypothetical protein